MKKILLIVACFCATFSYAQLPPNSFGEDFTITDINGQEHNLYDVHNENSYFSKVGVAVTSNYVTSDGEKLHSFTMQPSDCVGS